MLFFAWIVAQHVLEAKQSVVTYRDLVTHPLLN